MYVPGPKAVAIGERIDAEALDAEPGWEQRISALLDELEQLESGE